MPVTTLGETQEIILKIFVEYGNAGAIERIVDPYQLDIFENEFVDSFSITSIIAIIEEYFDITYSTEQLNSDQIRTIEGLAGFALNLIISDD